MTTAAQFIEYLKQLPPETQIEMLEERSGNWQTWTKFIPVVLPTVPLCETDGNISYRAAYKDNPPVLSIGLN